MRAAEGGGDAAVSDGVTGRPGNGVRTGGAGAAEGGDAGAAAADRAASSFTGLRLASRAASSVVLPALGKAVKKRQLTWPDEAVPRPGARERRFGEIAVGELIEGRCTVH